MKVYEGWLERKRWEVEITPNGEFVGDFFSEKAAMNWMRKNADKYPGSKLVLHRKDFVANGRQVQTPTR